MAEFNLSRNTMARLEKKFREFQKGREELPHIIMGYIADYQGYYASGNHHVSSRKKRKHQPLKFKYLKRETSGFYFGTLEIALVLGRNPSSITRTLVKMRGAETWKTKLAPLCKDYKISNGRLIPFYHQDIFKLFLEYYEEEYLLRFASPRNGHSSQTPDIQDLHRFWNHLKLLEEPREALSLNLDNIASVRQPVKAKGTLFRH